MKETSGKKQIIMAIIMALINLLSFAYFYLTAIVFVYIPIIGHMFQIRQLMGNDFSTMIRFQQRWLGNGVCMLPYNLFLTLNNKLALIVLVLIAVGLFSKKDETKRTSIKIIWIMTLIQMGICAIASFLQFVVGTAFYFIPKLQRLVTYRKMSLMSYELAISLFIWTILLLVINIVIFIIRKKYAQSLNEVTER